MQNDITKLCADSLRAFVLEKYGVKLKSTHAHELVAASFGYPSRNSMLADTKHPVSNLCQAKIIVMTTDDLIDQRRKNLQGLPSELPDSYVLAEVIYSVIVSNKNLPQKVQPNFYNLAVAIAKERLQQYVSYRLMNPATQWIIDVKTEMIESAVLSNVSFDYPTPKLSRYSKVDIKFPRVAGNIGYGIPEIMPTFYSGWFRDPDYNPDFDIKSGA